MSPIFIRPVREQLEHDRLIRHLAATYHKKFLAATNTGDDQSTPVKIGANTFYPDIVWSDGKRLAGLAEVETGESVNNLEAMAQWVHFAHAKAPFYLYVPVQGYDTARRLCDALNVKPTEVWTYRPNLDGFDLVRMFVDPAAEGQAAAAAKRAAKVAAAPVAAAPKHAPKVAKAPVNGTRATKAAKPVKAAKPAKPAKVVKPVAKSAKSAKPVGSGKAAKAVKSAKPTRSTAKASRPSKAGAKRAAKKGGAARAR